MIYKILIRPILFYFNAEAVHNFITRLITTFSFLCPVLKFHFRYDKKNPFEINGLKFRNRLGLAAGFDKNGEAIRFWDAIGFSHVEVGTVTPEPQPGNTKPRLFRLVLDKGIINRMGFNNKGADEVLKNISKARKFISSDFIIGVNIGKNKTTPIEKACEDYKICLEKLYDSADYFAINVSSPNTEGLRELQVGENLINLLKEITLLNNKLAKERNKPPKVIFLKIAPELSENELEEIYRRVIRYDINGIIATNTTVTKYDMLETFVEDGGLSGSPLFEPSNKILNQLNELNLKNKYDKISLIGVGGVFNKKDYNDKLNNGADLVQIYTGFIYEGLRIIKKILS
jgi:dihydroorotate dehydrogenase